MRFGVLGPVEARTESGEPVAVPGAKVRALLAALLVAEGESVSADRLLEDLWGPDAPAGSAPLQTAVSRLRRALDEAEPGARARVESGPSGYRLRVGPGELDAHRFAELMERARSAPAPAEAAEALDRALRLWRGPALADHADAPFAAAAVARWEERRAAAREELADARLALGEHAALVGDLDPLLRAHPLRERLRAAHMRALYLSGRQAEALESYRDFRALLAEEIGVDPGPELERLHAEILDRSLEGAPGGGPPSRKGNLPAPITEPVGREEDTSRVVALLESMRLTTLTGPGGVGKTTLAFRAADRARDLFPDGVWLVELVQRDCTSVSGERLAEHVAAALELRDEEWERPRPGGMRGAVDRLAAALRDRRALLVLDNCEQVRDAVAGLVERLLGAAPGVRVLATGREPLGVPGEALYTVPTLAPDDAVRLFADRAAAAAPGFTVDWRNAEAVAAVCRRLDGLPKAVELAAARIRAMGVAELAGRLDDRFRVLAAPAPGPRRQTLRAVVDWSWELLTPPERTVLRRVSVQVGTFPLAAAEAVCAPAAYGGPDDDEQVWEVLARLVDRSLVEVEHRPDGTTRYRLLETIGAYGRERLAEAGEDGRGRALHVAHWTAAAEEAAARVHGPGRRRALEALDADGPNLSTAVERAAEDGDAASALRIASALGWHRYLRGRNREAVRELTLALEAPGPAPDEARARARVWRAALGRMCGCGEETGVDARAALDTLGALDRRRDLAEACALFALVPGFATGAAGTTGPGRGGRAAGGLPPAAELAEEALRGYTDLDDTWGRAFALHARGWDALRRGDLAGARADAEESHRLFLRTGDPWGESRGAGLLGVLAVIAGDYGRARRQQQQAQRSAEEAGLWAAAAEELVRLGRVALATRDFDAADRYNREALGRLGADRCTGPATLAMGGLGMAARRRGALEEAEAHLRPVLEVHDDEGYQAGRASVLAELGFAAEMRGDAAEARRLHLLGLEASRATSDPRAVAQALEGLAGADVLEGRAESAARLLGASQAAREEAGAPQPAPERFDVDRITESAKRSLGEDAFHTLHTKGRSLTLEEASPVA